MLDHLIHSARSLARNSVLSRPGNLAIEGIVQEYRSTQLPLINSRGKGVDTPPIAQAPATDDAKNDHIIGHDLVAISMGTGGWVFKIMKRTAWLYMLTILCCMLEPKCHVMAVCSCLQYCVFVNTSETCMWTL